MEERGPRNEKYKELKLPRFRDFLDLKENNVYVFILEDCFEIFDRKFNKIRAIKTEGKHWSVKDAKKLGFIAIVDKRVHLFDTNSLLNGILLTNQKFKLPEEGFNII